MSSSPRRRAGAVLGAVVIGLLALTGCSTAEPGQAAVVGDVKIPESTIAEQMRALNEAVGQPPEAPNAEAAVQMVTYDVAFELIRQTADKLGVKVAQGRFDEYYAQQVQQFGGEEGLREAAAQQGLSPLLVRENFKAQLLVSELLNRIAPNAPQQEQSLAIQQLLAGVAEEIGVEVAPKYGAWDPSQVQVVPLPNPVSSPGASPAASPGAQLEPQPNPTP